MARGFLLQWRRPLSGSVGQPIISSPVHLGLHKLNYELDDEQRAYADSAREFSLGELAPNAATWDAEAVFPKAALKAAGDMGFMGMYTPESAGGLGMSRLDASLIVEELARGCTTTAAFLTIHNMATNMIGKYCQSSVIDTWCPALVAG